jgi:8-oxo-dGTP pyrophosphatase MutT (NUDIX family)
MTEVGRQVDLAAEGEPEAEFHQGIAQRMPRKGVAGGALIRNEDGLILFLEPTYKPTLDIPGGMAEQDESPLEACRREVREEIGLELEIGPLLVVDWVPAIGVWFDAVNFVFDGGVLSREQIQQLRIDPVEARGSEFLTLEQASTRLRPSMARRLAAAQEAVSRGATQYTEFGRL